MRRNLVLGLGLLLLGWACGDCFWEVRGHVLECGTMSIVSSVRIDVAVVGVIPAFTDEKGDFEVGTTDSCNDTEALIFTKEGFETIRLEFKGRQNGPVQVCMTRIFSQ